MALRVVGELEFNGRLAARRTCVHDLRPDSRDLLDIFRQVPGCDADDRGGVSLEKDRRREFVPYQGEAGVRRRSRDQFDGRGGKRRKQEDKGCK
jgi:hypothetical protein